MSILPSYLLSLLLTIIFSFITPILLIGGALVSVFLIGHIPGLHAISQAITEHILQFLATFGSHNPWRGIVVIGLTCSLVGALFDTYTFYRYQHLRNH